MISVLTPTIRGREALLERCKVSVGHLRIEHEHLVELDDPPSGSCAPALHRAQGRARYPWRIICPDDDYLLPIGVEVLVRRAEADGLDFVIGLQGQADRHDHIREWAGTFPEPGATGAFVWHERLNQVAELAEGYYGNGSTGDDYVLLLKWMASGAKYAFERVPVMVHRVG